MSGIGAAIVAGGALTGLLSANAQQNAAQKAADAQMQANQQALNAQQSNYQQALNYQNQALGQGNALGQQQNASLQKLLAPFIAAGTPGVTGLEGFAQGGQQAFQQQLALAGALGNPAQAQAISGVQNAPYFQALEKQAQTALLQNASATGGLRGGNTELALQQTAPALLNQILQQQFGNLSQLSGIGQGSASALAALGAGSAGTQAQGEQQTLSSLLGLTGQTAGNVANLSSGNASTIAQLLSQQGAIGAQNAVAQGQAAANMFGSLGGSINLAALLGNQNNQAGLNRAALGGGGTSGVPNFTLPNVGIPTSLSGGVNF